MHSSAKSLDTRNSTLLGIGILFLHAYYYKQLFNIRSNVIRTIIVRRKYLVNSVVKNIFLLTGIVCTERRAYLFIAYEFRIVC